MHFSSLTRVLVLLMALAFVLPAAAQTDDERLMPVKKDMGLTFDLTGLVNNIALGSQTDP